MDQAKKEELFHKLGEMCWEAAGDGSLGTLLDAATDSLVCITALSIATANKFDYGGPEAQQCRDEAKLVLLNDLKALLTKYISPRLPREEWQRFTERN